MTVVFVHASTFVGFCVGLPLLVVMAIIAHSVKTHLPRRALNYTALALLFTIEGLTCDVSVGVFVSFTIVIGLAAYLLWTTRGNVGFKITGTEQVEYLPPVPGQPAGERRIKKKTLASSSIAMCIVCLRSKGNGTMHCELCRVCVQGHVVHCPLSNVCIGKHNYHAYSVFLVTLLIHQLVVVSCALNSGVFMDTAVWTPSVVGQAFAAAMSFAASLSALGLMSNLVM